MNTATEKDCILAAREHIRKLGRARQIILMLTRQIYDLQKELVCFGSSERQRIALQIEEKEQEREQWRQALMMYEQARAAMYKRYGDAVHVIDFQGKTLVQASIFISATTNTIRNWEKRGLIEYAYSLLDMADSARK